MKLFSNWPERRRCCRSALALSIAALAGCHRPDPAPKSDGPAPVPVQVAQAVQQTLPVTQNAIGTVQPLRTVAVKSQVDGVIATIHFREGEEVQAGDLLVTLDERPFENSLRSAEADLATARAEAAQADAEAKRYQSLSEQSAISKEQYTQYQTKAQTTQAIAQAKEAAVSNAKLQLSYAEIRAPIAGRTGQLSLHEGSLVKANDTGQSIVVINQLTPILVAYSLPESALPAVQAAQAGGLVPVIVTRRAATTAKSIEGRLDFIDNSVDPTTGTIVLKAVFDNADRLLWPGQFVDVTTRIGAERDAILVPTAAVQAGQHGSQVFVMRPDHTVELRNVKTGRTHDGLTAIIDGVKPNETVVTDGQLRLVTGARVEVRTLGQSAAAVVAGPEDAVVAKTPTAPKS